MQGARFWLIAYDMCSVSSLSVGSWHCTSEMLISLPTWWWTLPMRCECLMVKVVTATRSKPSMSWRHMAVAHVKACSSWDMHSTARWHLRVSQFSVYNNVNSCCLLLLSSPRWPVFIFLSLSGFCFYATVFTLIYCLSVMVSNQHVITIFRLF